MVLEGSDLTAKAETLARKAHEGQFRWDDKTPYIEHPEAIAKSFYPPSPDILTNDLPIYVAVAWLHDVMEDTSMGWVALFNEGLPPPVMHALKAITKKSDENYLEYILRVKENEIAKEVKIRDIKHNMADLDDKQVQRKEKYLCALHILGKEKC